MFYCKQLHYEKVVERSIYRFNLNLVGFLSYFTRKFKPGAFSLNVLGKV